MHAAEHIVDRLLEAEDDMEAFIEPLRQDYFSTWATPTGPLTWGWHHTLTDKPGREVILLLDIRLFNSKHDAWPMVINGAITYNGAIVANASHLYGQGGYDTDTSVLTKGLYHATRKIIDKCSNLNWEDFGLLERIIWNTISQYVPEKPARS